MGAGAKVLVFGRFEIPVHKLYEICSPMPYDEARDMEAVLAIALREKGFGVWRA